MENALDRFKHAVEYVEPNGTLQGSVAGIFDPPGCRQHEESVEDGAFTETIKLRFSVVLRPAGG
jgi:hypothetical protein